MKDEDFDQNAPGKLVPTMERVSAFVPNPLPPELQTSWGLMKAHGDARAAMGKLEESLLGADFNPYLVIYPLMQREAFYSSQIEGTYTTPQEMALFDIAPPPDEATVAVARSQTREVLNYVQAMEYGLKELQTKRLPLCNRLFKALHRRLLEGTRGESRRLGEFRTTQNYIGRRSDGIANSRFVPPPAREMERGVADLEKFIDSQVAEDAALPPFVALALIHYQFETLHPFEDGNGRIGRLLLPLILVEKEIIAQPCLHVSASLDKHKEAYMDRLLAVSQKGAWTEWITFFLTIVELSALEALVKIAALRNLRSEYLAKVQTRRASGLLPKLIDGLFHRPSLTIKQAAKTLKVSNAQAASHVRRLESLGILKEVTGGDRYLMFTAQDIIKAIYD